MENEFYPFVNLPLPYAYDALEPFIDAKTMMLHHDRHLQTYIDNLNNALKDRPGLQELSLEQLICNASRLQDDVQRTIRNNAGGVYNHRFYFDLLTNPAKREPQGGLRRAINSRFGGFSEFREAFTKAALSVFGSGYAWLVCDGATLAIVTTPNQNNPLEAGLCPILTIDVWEHAYYLKHYNERANYIEDWVSVVNWERAQCNFEACCC